MFLQERIHRYTHNGIQEFQLPINCRCAYVKSFLLDYSHKDGL